MSQRLERIECISGENRYFESVVIQTLSLWEQVCMKVLGVEKTRVGVEKRRVGGREESGGRVTCTHENLIKKPHY